eukprot:383158-Rhodomonas_salina.1
MESWMLAGLYLYLPAHLIRRFQSSQSVRCCQGCSPNLPLEHSPQLRMDAPQVAFVCRDVGRDICAWRQVLMGELKHRVPITRHKRFILTNASIRGNVRSIDWRVCCAASCADAVGAVSGPFLPSFFREPWPELYYSLLNNQT